jgi:hypothetical protein
MHDAGTISPVGPSPAFGYHPAGTMEHQTMDIETGRSGVVEKRLHDRSVHARCARLAASQSV